MYGTFLFFTQFLLPLTVIAGSYGIIAWRLNTGKISYNQTSLGSTSSLPRRERSANKRKRTNRMFAAMIITFAVTSAPQVKVF
jgi:hypothetical protein